MSAAAVEAFLARIYVDVEARGRFLSNPHGEAQKAGLSEEECEALVNIDRVGLELAATSFAQKRAGKNHRTRSIFSRWARTILGRFMYK